MTVTRADAIERLVDGDGPCIGAAFVTYTFDATFFEEEILAALLPIHEDPTESTRRFLDEGRRGLSQTPVLVIADSTMLRGGQRLPFDLLRADARRTFHPKLALVLRRASARLVVGSGNLTRGGYGDNAELSVALTLDYQADSGLLRQVVSFLEACGASGEAWRQLRAELDPRLGSALGPEAGTPALLHTYSGAALLDVFLDRIPTEGKIARLGVLAPFHQEDGAPPDAAVLDRLLDWVSARQKDRVVLDVGVSWEGNPVAPAAQRPETMAGHQGSLWGFLDGDRGQESTNWGVLGDHVGHNFEVLDGRRTSTRSTRDMNARLTAGRAWPAGSLIAFAPEGLVDRAAKRADLHLWLHPELHRREGRTYAQGLHGKLLCVTVREGRAQRTHLLVGSPNASAMALLRPDGNVECALHLVIDGAHHLGTLCETLVHTPRAQVTLRGRTFSAAAASPGRWIEDAIFDAATGELVVTWGPGAPVLELNYPLSPPRPLFDGRPEATLVLHGFELDPACCELEVVEQSQNASARVPLRIVNRVELPLNGLPADLGLDDLLMLHTGRASSGGLGTKRAGVAGAESVAGDSTSILGTALTPRQVFRALGAVAGELVKAPSLSAFEAMVRGPWGVERLAARIVEAPGKGELLSAEAWVYGHELARSMAEISFESDPTAAAKCALRDGVVARLRCDLLGLQPRVKGIHRVRKLYEESV